VKARGAKPDGQSGERRGANILAIETSCDDTCAAVVDGDGRILSNAIASQGLLHEKYGGVVPEIASRHHLEIVDAITRDALEGAGVSIDEIDRVAVTRGPGLIGALLVGLSSAKALAAARGLPLIPVDHLHGHVVASTLGDDPIEPPFLCLVASGGHTFIARVEELHTYEILGQTLDDAAGEAFDKGARILGLGYPGGPIVDRLAREGDPAAFDFPRSKPGRKGSLDFSFSGLKTSLLYKARDLGDRETERRKADLAASYQAAIVDSLVARLATAVEREGARRVALGGGVAANSALRAAAERECERLGARVWIPPIALCTDNAAMIAAAARFTEPMAYPDYLALDAAARPAAA
jgi:N6-L-threonylcarbamoyladenine synthase